MTNVIDAQKRMSTLSEGTELQEWRVERTVDGLTEYHMYIGHNFSKPTAESNSIIHSKGAIWMLFKLTNPGEEGVTQETLYRMGRTGLPSSGNDIALTEWTGRAAATYKRFDEVLREFFN